MRKNGNLVRAKARDFGSADMKDLMQAFAPWLDIAAWLGKPVRKRLFSPARVFWLFLSQVLSPDGSCQCFLSVRSCMNGSGPSFPGATRN